MPALTGLLNIGCLALFLSLLKHIHSKQLTALKFYAVSALFFLSWFTAGLCWLFISMHRYGNMPSVMAAAAVVLFAAYLSSFYMAAIAIVVRVCRHKALNLWLLAIALVLADIFRGYLFSGFPWLAFGYAHTDTPLASVAPYLGVYGVGLMAMLLATCLNFNLKNKTATSFLVLIFVACGLASLVQNKTPRDETAQTVKQQKAISVALIQGNVAQEMKFDSARIRGNLNAYTDAIEAATEDLIVLPETAWTTLWKHTPNDLKERIAKKAVNHAIVIGLPFVEGGTIANSVAKISANATLAYRYDKHHLVPFGEFIPLGFDWFVRMMNIPLGNFDSGSLRQPPLQVGAEKVAFNICYEDLFGEELIEAVRNGATILINVSNLAWFGDSHALFQHLQIARMRSMETSRPMLRSTNTGTTAHIDANGKVVAQLNTFEKATLSISVQGRTEKTFYVQTGNWPTLLLCAGLLLWAMLGAPAVKIKP
jgi:apolipoprotein N-acyltransferase